MDEIIAAAKSANAHTFISNLPDGYDTQVGERGVQMSGGQKQRIAITRAMLKDPSILLFDEATSALDAASEKTVQDALDHASVGRTTVIIAHRLSTIRNADLIAVFQGGQVIESGRHEDLIERNQGAYAALVDIQQKRTEEEEYAEDDDHISTGRMSWISISNSTTISMRSNAPSDFSPNPEQIEVFPAPSFRRMLTLNAPEWKQALMGCITSIGFGAVPPANAYALGGMTSVFFLKDHKLIKIQIRWYSLFFAALGVFSFIMSVLQQYNFTTMGEFLTRRVRERMLSKILTFEIGWFDREENSSGALCSRIAKEANVLKSLVGDRLALIVSAISTVSISFTVGLVIAWQLSVVMIAVQPILVACYCLRISLLQTKTVKARIAQDRMSQLSAESVANHRTITAFSSQERILRLYDLTQEAPHRESMRYSWVAGLVLATSQSFTFCASALAFWYGGRLVYKGDITASSFFKAYLILNSTGRVIANTVSMNSDVAKGLEAVKSVFASFDRKTLINPDENALKSLVGDRLSFIVSTISTVTISFTIGLVLAWQLALVMIAVQPTLIACFYLRKILIRKMSVKARIAQNRGSQLSAEAVVNHRTITAFSSQDRILRLFDQAQEAPHRESVKQSWTAGIIVATSQALTLCSSALDFWYGGHLVYKGDITARSFFRTYLTLSSTGRVIANTLIMNTDLAKGSEALKSVFAIFDRKTHINPDAEDAVKTERIDGFVALENVHFAYPSRPEVLILKNFNLRIKAGSSLALVGQSGSGKSTIIGLIERFYDPQKGKVKIDDKDIKKYNLRCLRQHISLVGQEPTLFLGSIRDNILYGKENATEAEVIEAAKAANAHEFISCLEKGYETECGERGVQLSGGQKQRIAIARAIIKNPRILLLDEATSALDSQSEQLVQEALNRLMVGRTSIIVAHRLNTIQNADSIAVIENGMIVEQGTHNFLISKGEGSQYFALMRLQQQ